MDFALSEEQIAIQDMARGFAADHIAPHAAHWDETATFPVDTLRAAAELGLAGIYCGEAHGGSGLSRLDAALVFEALSQACVSTAAFLSIHNMVGWMIDAFGNAEQRARFLPQLMTMQTIASYCLTEPGSGSDAASLKTRAERRGSNYVLTGSKAFISGGSASDLYLVMARTGGPGPKGISAFLVPAGAKGLSFGKRERKLGWNSQPTAAVMFDGCEIPADNRLGPEGEGFTFAMKALDGGRVNIGACSLGGAVACIDAARAYVGQRKQFDRPIATFQATQFKLADMATHLEAARLMVYRAAVALDRRATDQTMWCAMAKRFATDTCFDICDEALQLHGGYGYIRDYPVERFLRDLRVHRILEGTNEIMRVIIARHLLAA